MIIESLTLDNFGVYSGRQQLSLEPLPGRPVTLIGALNGGGKTTILEALQLALYGRSSRFIDTRRGGYAEYLKGSVNRANLQRSASVEVVFTSRVQGKDVRYRVLRTWALRADSVVEHLDLEVDGVLEPSGADRWAEYMEAMMPAQISDLFFFDGERIETLADPDRSAQLIATGLHSLLGLDLVDDLARSLTVLSRRIRADQLTESDQSRLTEASSRVDIADARLSAIVGVLAEKQTQLDGFQRDLCALKARFEVEGGALRDQRANLERKRADASAAVVACRSQLLEIASGLGPLVLVQDQLEGLVKGAEAHQLAVACRSALSIIKKRDQQLLESLSNSQQIPAKSVAALMKELARSHAEIEKSSEGVLELPVAPEIVNNVIAEIKAQRSLAARTLHKLRQAQEIAEYLETQLAAVPDDQKLAPVVAKLADLEGEVRTLEVEIRIRSEEKDAAVRERDVAAAALAKVESMVIGKEFDDRMSALVHRQIGRSQSILSTFRSRMRDKHIGRLEALITESFRYVMRKQSLVERVKIDPQTFQLSLCVDGNGTVPAKRLSAGERQLLAVAILWALAKASGRKLPTFIDTPLGRLDSIHRRLLIENYFPIASHQVILLSTDEEIAGHYLEQLAPFIARRYLIEYDESTRGSVLTQGYFQPLAEVA
jgi:DNA sulfur modification protein DndD